METSASDDEDGESAASSYRFIPFFFFILIPACSKPTSDAKKLRVVVDSPPAAKKMVAATKKPVKKKKKIYLTFDDGPNKGTPNVLAIVEQENIPATFFIVGEHVFASLEQARTWDSLQAATGIELCNHSYTHALHNHYEKFYENPDTVVKDVELTEEKLQLDNHIVRAPGRNCWRIDSLCYTDIKKSAAALDSLQNAGYTVMGWDLEWHYDPQKLTVSNNAEQLLSQVDSVFGAGKTKTQDNLVLLAHDQVYETADDSLELRNFVQKLKERDDYELMLASSYPNVNCSDSLK